MYKKFYNWIDEMRFRRFIWLPAFILVFLLAYLADHSLKNHQTLAICLMFIPTTLMVAGRFIVDNKKEKKNA